MLEIFGKVVKSRWFIGLTIVLLCVAIVVTFLYPPEETKQAVEKLVVGIPLATMVAGGLAASAAGYSIYRYLAPKKIGWNNENYEVDSNNFNEYDKDKGLFYDHFQKKKRTSPVELSEGAAKASSIFKRTGNSEKGIALPAYARKQGVEGEGKILIPNNRYVTGFQGIADNDLASVFHMVIIPKNEVGPDGRLIDLLKKDLIPAHVGELNSTHVPLLMEMRKAGLQFLKDHRKELEERFGPDVIEREIRLGPRFGFHLKPSVGYLHMHMLLGNLTEEGRKEAYKWIPFDDAVSRALMTKEEDGFQNPPTQGIR